MHRWNSQGILILVLLMFARPWGLCHTGPMKYMPGAAMGELQSKIGALTAEHKTTHKQELIPGCLWLVPPSLSFKTALLSISYVKKEFRSSEQAPIATNKQASAWRQELARFHCYLDAPEEAPGAS